MQVSAGSDTFVIPLEGLIDIDAEKARLAKALAASDKEAAALEGRLGNANFVERAKPEAVDKARADHAAPRRGSRAARRRRSRGWAEPAHFPTCGDVPWPRAMP